MSAYRTAVDETTRTIDLRARYFRNQVVIVVSISLLVILAAVLTRWSALWAWLLLVPACGAFFYVDARVLNGWRKALSGPWIGRDIDFEVLRQTIRANPAMPKDTADGMLATLPAAGSVAEEQAVSSPTRRAIAAVALATHQDKAESLLLQATASGIVVAALIVAVWTRSWTPLAGLGTIAVLPVARTWARGRRRARSDAEVNACRAQSGFSEADYDRVRASLR